MSSSPTWKIARKKNKERKVRDGRADRTS